MSRPLRIQRAGLAYHVMSRGNNKMRILLDDLDYARFLEILGNVTMRFELDLWVHCPMPNHWHLVLRTRRPNISLAMRHLNGTYAQWWNKRHGHVGHVYQGRFKAQIVEECTYLLRLCRYVLMNPVRAGIARHPRDWKWSSYAALAGARPALVDVESLVHAIDPDAEVRAMRPRLLGFVEGYVDDEMAALVRSDRRVIGSEEFTTRFERPARGASKEVPRRERQIGTPTLATLLARAVQRGDGLTGGVRDARAALYEINDIAACAGLSTKAVTRIVKNSYGGDLTREISDH